jgi:hypothetical protein
MKVSKNRWMHKIARTNRHPRKPQDRLTSHEPSPLPMLMASVFAKLRLVQRAKVLRRLLIPVGPMALVVLGGGAFAKFVDQARWSGMSVSLDDAARVTPGQVLDLVRYVEQSNPGVLQEVTTALARDPMAMAAVGASLAAVVMRQLLTRDPSRAPLGRPG